MASPVGRPSAGLPPPGEIHRDQLEETRRSGGGSTLPAHVDGVRSRPAERVDRSPGAVRRKPTRTLSGVAVVAVMTAPSRCPHGRCTYCPGGLENASPQSYTGEEPSALRGAQFHWDARAITAYRIESLEAIGHPTSKVEVIVMGGTFPSRPRAYQEEVFRGIYGGLNGTSVPSREEAHALNETSSHRLVGLTVETRPDWCDDRVLPYLLDWGVTRVEVGVECLDEKTLAAVGRAHDLSDVARASRSARERGLKLCYHMMLGLPGMTPEEDLRGFEQLFSDPRYRPDMLKIYPTLVLPGTPLFEEWQQGRYRPYDTSTAVDLLARIKRKVPPWVRIQRIQRDIPARLIAAGVRTSNLRQLALARLGEGGATCPCLRCREVGRRAVPSLADLTLLESSYEATPGKELFLSWVDASTDAVAGFLRLHVPDDTGSDNDGLPIVRELKVLGRELPVGHRATSEETYQHRGLGRSLMARAEEVSRTLGFRALRVISAVGTRPYYRRLGYEREGPYMRRPLGAS